MPPRGRTATEHDFGLQQVLGVTDHTVCPSEDCWSPSGQATGESRLPLLQSRPLLVKQRTLLRGTGFLVVSRVPGSENTHLSSDSGLMCASCVKKWLLTDTLS